MSRPEQLLWQRVRPRLTQYGIFVERIENVVNFGTPDAHALVNGRATWIELKMQPDIPKRARTALLGKKKGANRDQRNWHLEYQRRGGNSCILIGYGDADKFVTIDGRHADDVNRLSLAALLDLSCADDYLQLVRYLGANV